MVECELPLTVGQDGKNSASDANKIIKEAPSSSVEESEGELELGKQSTSATKASRMTSKIVQKL